VQAFNRWNSGRAISAVARPVYEGAPLAPTGLPPSPMAERYSRVGRSHKCGNRKVAGPRFVSTMTLSTLSQLKHSNVRTSKASRAVLTRVSTIGAWHLMQGRLSILSDG
jgi:hypothetical protein